jgi:uncharacterized delta-60 repeat protein
MPARQLNVMLYIALVFFSLLATDAAASPGSLDTSFNFPHGYVLFNSAANSRDRGVEVALQADGKIIILGYSHNGANEDVLLVRYNTDGTLDTGFGGGGYVLYNGGGNDRGLGLALQTDGKIVAVGYTYVGTSRDVLTLRYNINGTLDSTFGAGGKVTYSSPGAATDIGFGVVIQADGCIIVAGEISNTINQDALVLRYTPAGTLDNSFGSGGVFTYAGPGVNMDRAFAAAIQMDGKIIITGASVVNGKDDVLVLRLNINGTLDGTFGSNGIVTYSGAGDNSDYGNAVALREDGRIVVLGAQSNGSAFDILLLQLTAAGALDSQFGTGGVVIYGDAGSLNDYGYGLALQKDEKIVITGYTQGTNDNVLVVRFNAGGTLDTSFGSEGLVIWNGSASGTDYGQGIALQPDGKMIITGFSHNGVNEDMLVMRLWASADDGRRCFIATAAYGSDLDPHVAALRQFRDEHLMTNRIGRQLIKLYYTYSPPLAIFIEQHDWLKPVVRSMLAPAILAVNHPDVIILGMTLGGMIFFILLMRRRI